MTHHGHDRAAAVILVGGHESAGGRTLPTPAELRVPGQALPTVTAAGRDLERAIERARHDRGSDGPVVVVPMTLGRDPRLVSDTARTVRWAGHGADAGTLALTPPFGTSDHLISHLRAACRRLDDDGTAVLITAPAADPFDDAELYRVAALVRTHAPHELIEVGLRRPGGDPKDDLDRCRRLGATRVAVVPAAFGVPDGADGPLLTAPAIATIVAARVATAVHRLAAHGDDGVTAAHDADHHHGFAHSHDADHHHGFAHSHEADGHTHTDGHGHAPAHTHGPGHAHDSGRPHRPDGDGPRGRRPQTHSHPHTDDPLAVG